MRNRAVALFAVVPLLALAACAPGGSAGTGGDGGSSGDGGAGSLDCSTTTTAGYDLFVDPRLEIEPQLDVYPLDAGDSIAFTDTGTEGVFTTYSYSVAYIQGDGSAIPTSGAIFVGAEDTGEWTLEGPITATGVTGGPYPAFLDIEATTDGGTTVIARLCGILPAS